MPKVQIKVHTTLKYKFGGEEPKMSMIHDQTLNHLDRDD